MKKIMYEQNENVKRERNHMKNQTKILELKKMTESKNSQPLQTKEGISKLRTGLVKSLRHRN